jgi:hypothetical protein
VKFFIISIALVIGSKHKLQQYIQEKTLTQLVVVVLSQIPAYPSIPPGLQRKTNKSLTKD